MGLDFDDDESDTRMTAPPKRPERAVDPPSPPTPGITLQPWHPRYRGQPVVLLDYDGVINSICRVGQEPPGYERYTIWLDPATWPDHDWIMPVGSGHEFQVTHSPRNTAFIEELLNSGVHVVWATTWLHAVLPHMAERGFPELPVLPIAELNHDAPKAHSAMEWKLNAFGVAYDSSTPLLFADDSAWAYRLHATGPHGGAFKVVVPQERYGLTTRDKKSIKAWTLKHVRPSHRNPALLSNGGLTATDPTHLLAQDGQTEGRTPTEDDAKRAPERALAHRPQRQETAPTPGPGPSPETPGADGLTDSQRRESARRYERATTLSTDQIAAARHHLRHAGELIIGLDGEMSGNDLAAGSALIQVGLAMWIPTGLDVFSQVLNPGAMQWQPDAEAVHGITRHMVEAAAPATEVDAAAAAWLIGNGAPPDRRAVIATGFNVAGFDLPFFRKYLPQTTALISRRSIDLNALCFTLAGWDPIALDSARDWSGWRRSARTHAATQLHEMGIAGSAHDAGWDAAEALLAFRWLRLQIHKCTRPRRFDSPDPLAQLFGTGLLRRLRGLTRDQLTQLADAFTTAGVKPSHWLGKPHVELASRTGLQALLDGDIGTVLALLAALERKAGS